MKSLEALERIGQITSPVCQEDEDCLIIIEKSLKALEIIKKCCLLGMYGYGDYELSFVNKISITQEEYDLLKEALE